MKQSLTELKNEHYRIIYLDEAVFTTKTIRKTEYTPNRKPLRVEQRLVNQPCYALIFSISAENGIEFFQIFEKSVDQTKFSEYLLNLRRSNQFEKIAIFLDNLTAHKTISVKEKLKQ